VCQTHPFGSGTGSEGAHGECRAPGAGPTPSGRLLAVGANGRWRSWSRPHATAPSWYREPKARHVRVVPPELRLGAFTALSPLHRTRMLRDVVTLLTRPPRGITARPWAGRTPSPDTSTASCGGSVGRGTRHRHCGGEAQASQEIRSASYSGQAAGRAGAASPAPGTPR